jgi:hypothetical protein
MKIYGLQRLPAGGIEIASVACGATGNDTTGLRCRGCEPEGAVVRYTPATKSATCHLNAESP